MTDGVWNYVNVGCKNAHENNCSNSGANHLNISETPLIAEKPYIVESNGKFKLMKPHYETNKQSSTANWLNSEEIDFSDVYVASEHDSASTINGKLSAGSHVLLQPGRYTLD
jgi:hypothetical protein